MSGEITTIKHGRIKATVTMQLLPLGAEDELQAYDAAGNSHWIPSAAVDLKTLEQLLADHRERFLTKAGYGHAVVMQRGLL